MINHHLYDIEQSLTTSQMMALIPGNLYWKALNGEYVGSNNSMLRYLGMNSDSEIIGKNDIELHGGEWSQEIMANDRLVIAKLAEQTFYERAYLPVRERSGIFLSKKVPFYNQNNTLIAVCVSDFETKFGVN